ncbi:C40 family peptidase [Streptomyces sp. NPDC087658]|uniref:C40 family peptidase n=1 Tax=Streptomyces sp. NPDC087658 TaxID=3365800 RepID=UPI0037F8CCBC
MASHRKSRNRSEVTNSPAVGFPTAALASVTLLSTQGAEAAPAVSNPSIEEVQKKVNDLYRQAGSGTSQLSKAKEITAEQKRAAEQIRGNAPKGAGKVSEQRRRPPSYAEQVEAMERLTERRQEAVSAIPPQPQSPPRPMSPPPAAPSLQVPPPAAPSLQVPPSSPPMPQTPPPPSLRAPQAAVAPERPAENTEVPADPQNSLRVSKETVQKKLTTARALLSKLTAEERTRVATLELKKEAERRRAKAEAEAAGREGQPPQLPPPPLSTDTSTGINISAIRSTGTMPVVGAGTGVGPAVAAPTLPAPAVAAPVAPPVGPPVAAAPAPAPVVPAVPVPVSPAAPAAAPVAAPLAGATAECPADAYAAKAARVIAFAAGQIGKPYVWGASGPSSYDCSGLTQVAWREVGVQLPRSTWEQAKAGAHIATDDLLPGDLVFFYDDVSHVGIYIGDGMMIHAPKPGSNVREESIYYMPIYGSVRPA